ncbi:helix-turn-helix domain-containing protein [Actinoplanes siamensis]|uniref:HTH cro/C1-type domain-containing protein n=1 Tax=Actinoplanes siamensis TaxID=1223317 RepID=A0A919TP77_9ACTN|nr:helix-turn-helix transcriptional regulator [Actinoplanes siamensis]GIF08635.1 hypothetical protein Asi03nite_61730 [Actinoplanes siamensis]
MAQPTIGENIARFRRARPMTQEDLAEAAGVSVETIRKLEQGKSGGNPRMSTLNRLARALGVPATRLLGDASRETAAAVSDIDQLGLIQLRQALQPPRGLRGVLINGPEVDAPSLVEVSNAIRALDVAYHRDDYATTLSGLPLLITEARSAVSEASTDDRAQALELMAQTYQLAGTTLIQLHAFDLAHQALNDALDAAGRAGNDVIGGSVITTMCWLMLRQARFDEVEQLAVVTADAINPSFARPNPAQLAVWGWLLLRAGAAAVRNNRDDDADGMLNAAAAAAVRIGDRVPTALLSPGPATIGAFCPTTVAWKRVESELIAGHPDRALELARTAPVSERPTSNNRNRHQLDVAAAHLQVGQPDDAQGVLLTLKETAPAWLRHQRLATDLVSSIIAEKKRALGTELAALAELVGTER